MGGVHAGDRIRLRAVVGSDRSDAAVALGVTLCWFWFWFWSWFGLVWSCSLVVLSALYSLVTPGQRGVPRVWNHLPRKIRPLCVAKLRLQSNSNLGQNEPQ